MTPRRAHRAQDLALGAALGGLGLVEIWLPMESVMGDGSAVLSSVAVVISALVLTQRRQHPAWLVALPWVWVVVALVDGGGLLVLFFGQLVFFVAALYSLGRHAAGRLPWVGAASYAVAILIADLTVTELQSTSEIVFHWCVLVLGFAVGRGLRASEERAVSAALRVAEVEAVSREHTLSALVAERARIARELHDIVAHTMSGMVVQAGAAAQVVDEDPEFVRRALETIRSGGSEALAEMRRLVGMLRADDEVGALDPQPGLEALDELLTYSRSHGVEVDYVTEGCPGPLPAGLDLAAYRIVQESLTNVRKHSAAARARVLVQRDDTQLLVEVTDEGPQVARRPGGAGHGLTGMRERVAMYGGHVETGMTELGGYRVRATLPLAGTP